MVRVDEGDGTYWYSALLGELRALEFSEAEIADTGSVGGVPYWYQYFIPPPSPPQEVAP